MRAIIVNLKESELLPILTGTSRLKGIPVTATMTRVWMDVDHDPDSFFITGQRFCLRLEDASFAAVPPGRKIPQIEAVIEREQRINRPIAVKRRSA